MGILPIVSALLLITCGLLAAADVVVKKRPEAAELIEKLRKYKGWIGVAACLLGLLCFIWALVSLRHASLFSGGMWVSWITWLLGSLGNMGLGFLLGFPLVHTMFLKTKDPGPGLAGPAVADTPAPPPVQEAPAEPATAVGEEAAAPEPPAEAPAEPAAEAPAQPPAQEPAAPPVAEPQPAMTAQDLAQGLFAKLAALQVPMGLAGLGLGVWSLLATLIWMPPSAVFLGIILSLSLLTAGALAAATFLAKKRPEAAPALARLGGYQEKVGLTTLVLGLVTFVYTLRIVGLVSSMARMSKLAAKFGGQITGTSSGGLWVWWVTLLLASLLALAVGFLLAFPMLKKHLFSKGGGGEEQAEALRAKLAGLQIPMGLAALGLGLWAFLATLIWAP